MLKKNARNSKSNRTRFVKPARTFRSQRVRLQPVRRVNLSAKNGRQTVKQMPKILRIALWLIGGVAVVILIICLLGFFFSVEQITCTINDRDPCPEILVRHLSGIRHRSLFFTDFADLLTQVKNPQLDFVAVDFHKRLPHTLDLNFAFEPALYEVKTSTAGSFYLTARGALAHAGDGSQLLVINDRQGTIEKNLMNATLDNFWHQKILELNTWRKLSTVTISQIDYYDLETVVIALGQRFYVVDLLSLDEGLQKIDFLEQNWRADDLEENWIDLRFRLPVLRTDANFLTATVSAAYNGGNDRATQ